MRRERFISPLNESIGGAQEKHEGPREHMQAQERGWIGGIRLREARGRDALGAPGDLYEYYGLSDPDTLTMKNRVSCLPFHLVNKHCFIRIDQGI